MENKKTSVILGIFFILLVCFVIFLSIIYVKIVTPRKIPTLQSTKIDTALRGSIFSLDGFEVASSSNLYKASINTQSIDADKKELFINLFSIYSGIPREQIEKKFLAKGNVVLSYNLSNSVATNLKKLNLILLRYDVFKEYENANGVVVPKQGLSIEVSGNNRAYPYKALLEPLIGYVRKGEIDGITRVYGLKGVEKYYNEILASKQDGEIIGKRDVGFNVILDKEAVKKIRQDGFDVTLSIPLRVQHKLEEILDRAKSHYNVQEVIAGVMDSYNGRFLALATSNRFNPNALRDIKDYSFLNLSVLERIYEPGSTIKPIIYAILLEKNRINPTQIIDLEGGVYKLHNYTIRDSSVLDKGTSEDILLRSSNIGMVKLAASLSAKELHTALKAFGFSELSGIDLPYEKRGTIPSVRRLNIEEATKATISYGYGLQTTFMQLMRSYASFSNGGFLPTPRITQYISAKDSQRYNLPIPTPIQILSPHVAKKIEELLIQVVQRGTGKPAFVENVIVGGKTGTAKIAKNGEYINQYNGSFFGFAKDSNHTYTIGVVVFESHIQNDYYGGRTAAPIFKEIVEMLIDEGYLKKIDPY
ncbi:peptidoglycan D,D-transpeptidase FtsI family protein [Helicobacter equorum]|uniref:peptidoglycan D,D-transpeptidase FtsI family protein n=1 Tax=Helicobacter equorum TaxID=361872 RepID=UPI000CF01C34|nr:penicillin-binding protein 2 [Helicobacter equorum]